MTKVSKRPVKVRVPDRPVLVVPPDYPSGAIQLRSLVRSKRCLDPVNDAARRILGTY